MLSNLNKTLHESHPREELTNQYINTSWYSMIHSLYEAWDLIVYDQSHKLHGGVNIHQCTRIRLKFPEGKNLFVLFNGYLAHSGSNAIQEQSISSFNFKNSLRLFAYVDKYANINDRNDDVLVRTRSTTSSISDQAADGTVDHENTNLCNILLCQICQDNVNKTTRKNWNPIGNSHNGELVIHLNDCYDYVSNLRKQIMEKQKRKRSRDERRGDPSNPPAPKKTKFSELMKVDYSKPLLVCGNLKENGWAVYEGVDVTSSEYLNVINELEHSINGKGTGNFWTKIHGDGIVGERKLLQINQLRADRRDLFLNTTKLFDDIEEHISNIDEFEDSAINKAKIAILRNKGNTPEQRVHRDQVKY